jgi:hypothetical protein
MGKAAGLRPTVSGGAHKAGPKITCTPTELKPDRPASSRGTAADAPRRGVAAVALCGAPMAPLNAPRVGKPARRAESLSGTAPTAPPLAPSAARKRCNHAGLRLFGQGLSWAPRSARSPSTARASTRPREVTWPLSRRLQVHRSRSSARGRIGNTCRNPPPLFRVRAGVVAAENVATASEHAAVGQIVYLAGSATTTRPRHRICVADARRGSAWLRGPLQ